MQAGCDYQFASHWVIGFGGDYSWTDLNSVANDPFFNGKNGRPIGLSTPQTDEIASLTGRVGYAWDKRAVLRQGRRSLCARQIFVEQCRRDQQRRFRLRRGAGPCDCAIAGSADRWGWTAGVGLEWAFATNWSAFAEYDHYGFDTKTIQMNVTQCHFHRWFRPTSTSGTTSTP